jgi:hypothetical protein
MLRRWVMLNSAPDKSLLSLTDAGATLDWYQA